MRTLWLAATEYCLPLAVPHCSVPDQPKSAFLLTGAIATRTRCATTLWRCSCSSGLVPVACARSPWAPNEATSVYMGGSILQHPYLWAVLICFRWRHAVVGGCERATMCSARSQPPTVVGPFDSIRLATRVFRFVSFLAFCFQFFSFSRYR